MIIRRFNEKVDLLVDSISMPEPIVRGTGVNNDHCPQDIVWGITSLSYSILVHDS